MKLLLGRTITNNIDNVYNFTRRWSPKYVVKRTNCLHKQYYVQDIYGYKWTKDITKATVFRGLDRVESEIKSTQMMYESYFEVVKL
jgi:hypothetical protein